MANYFDYYYLSELVQDADPNDVPVAVSLFLQEQEYLPEEDALWIIVVAPGKGHRTLRWYWKVQDRGLGIIQEYLFRGIELEDLRSLWDQSTSGTLQDQWLDVIRHYLQKHNLTVRAALPTNPLENKTQTSCEINDLGHQCMEVIVAYRVQKDSNEWINNPDNPGNWIYAPIRQRQVVPVDTDPDDEKYLCPGEVRLTDEKAIAALIENEKRKHD